MFRPYNIKSLLAWTVGSLAGNQAYYDTKIKQARDKENASPHSAQLAKEYRLYEESGGSLGFVSQFDNFTKERCEEILGKFDPNLAREVIGSLSILEQKIERIELAVQRKKISKSVLEDALIIFIHSTIPDLDGDRIRISVLENLQHSGFFKKYWNTLMWIKWRHENKADPLYNYTTLLVRFMKCLEAATLLQPDLWDTVINEFNQKNSKTPLMIKMATWEFVKMPSNAKIY